MKRIAIAVCSLVFAPLQLLAQNAIPGNLLVATDDVVYETTTAGEVLRSFPTEYPGGYPSTEYARDIAIDGNGIIHVYNGTFSPYMSSYDPASATWTHRTHPDFDTANNGTYGGIDVSGDRVFVTDGLSASGVIEFNTVSGQSYRFAAGTDAIDLTTGLDGLLYVLSPGGSPGGRTIDVYDPDNYTLTRSIDLTAIFGWTEHRSVAVDQSGDLYIADWDGEIHHVSAAGQLVQTVNPQCDWIGRDIDCSFYDIDVSDSGQLALGSRFGEVIVTDTDFSSFTKFEIGNRGTFVEFVPNPQPAEIEIDVRPGRDPNRINLSRKRNLWVAVLSDESFDATSIDPYSVRLGPGAAGINRSARINDVDGDQDLDLRLRFAVSEIGIACGDTELRLTAQTTDGTAVIGSDAIVTRGCN